MPTVEVNGQDIDFPDNLTGDQLNQAVSKAASQMGTSISKSEPEPGTNLMFDLVQGAKHPWSVGLKLPEKYASSGLKQLSSMVPKPNPTGNLPMDLIKGTPRIAADTLAETAPSFVSKPALLMSAAAPLVKAVRPLASAARQGLFNQAEDMAMGSKGKGALEAAYQDSSTILSRGKQAAKPLYEAAKGEIEKGAGLFDGMVKNTDIIDKAVSYMEKGGRLEPAEALTARKAVDALWGSKTYSKDALSFLRDHFDQMAKVSDNISDADKLYKKGVFGEALRKLLPQNLRGGTSPFKMAIGTALSEMGGAGKVLSAGLSPAALGTGATAMGMATRGMVNPILNNPILSAALFRVLTKKKQNQE